jgi:hypothetical protein
MRKNGYFIRVTCVSLMLLTFSAFVQAQQTAQVEPSFDVALQLVVGSNDGVRGDVPAELTGVTKQIKRSFGLTNYRLATTFIGRISNRGGFEYKSTSNIFGQESTGTTQTFLDWSLRDLRTMPTGNGRTGFQADSFRFGARVPVLTGGSSDPAGKGAPIYNYEPIGIALSRVGLMDGSPTLIGTLNLPGTSGTIFLIMTVRSADQ